MSIDSNRLGHIFYCPSVGVTTAQVQRSVPKTPTHSFEQSISSPSPSSSSPSSLSSSSNSPPSTSPSTLSTSSSMGPFILIRPPSRINLPPQSPNSIPILPTPSGAVKMLNITITRKRLKVTAGNNELPISILKPIAQTIRPMARKVRKLDIVPPISSNIPSSPSVAVELPKETNSQAQCAEPATPPETVTPPNGSPPIPPEAETPSPIPVLPSPQTSTLTRTQSSVGTATSGNPEIAELCPYCDLCFYTYNSLTLHLLTAHYATPVRNVKSCPTCKVVYREYSEYAFHCLHSHSCLPPTGIEMECLVSVSSPVNPIYRKCLICNRTFSSTRAIMIHFADHLGTNGAYQCRFCRTLVTDLWPLVIHLRKVHVVKFKYPKPKVSPEAATEPQVTQVTLSTTTPAAAAAPTTPTPTPTSQTPTSVETTSTTTSTTVASASSASPATLESDKEPQTGTNER